MLTPKSLLPLLTASLLMVFLMGVVPSSLHAVEVNPCAQHTGSFMGRASHYFCVDQEPVTLYGASFYPFWQHSGTDYRAMGWLRPDFKEYIDTIMDQALAAGLNTLRPTNYLDDAYFWDYDIVWENLDYLIQQAEARGLWIILDLSTYRHWLKHKGIVDVYNITRWTPFLEFVGERYRASTAVAHYSLLGEIPDAANTGMSPDAYIAFYRAALDILHQADGGHHLMSVGGLSYLNYASGIPWEALYDLPHNDIAAIHIYSDGDRTVSLPRVFTWARNRQMPLLIEEFGFRQEMGDALRAQAFSDMFDLLESYAASGMLFWNLGLEVAPVSYDVNPTLPRVWEVIQQYAP